jgi:hypothetical protein
VRERGIGVGEREGVGIRVGGGIGVSVEVGAGRVGSAVPNSGVMDGADVIAVVGTQAPRLKTIDSNRDILYNALAFRDIPGLVIKSTSNYLVRSQ